MYAYILYIHVYVYIIIHIYIFTVGVTIYTKHSNFGKSKPIVYVALCTNTYIHLYTNT